MNQQFSYKKVGSFFFFLFLLVASLLSWNQVEQRPPWSPIVWSPIAESSSQTPLYKAQLIPNANQNSTHSVSATVLPSGDLIGFWFGGSREGGKDVQIFQSYFQQGSQLWSSPKGILNVPQLGADLGRYIGKIGNPLVFIDRSQRMWLFFVTVSYGGWAGSSINLMVSDDLGVSWGTPKKLITSPFINVSTLVRNTMYELEDGSVVLPVYHEFTTQFPEILRVSTDGEVISKVRMHGKNGGIQPSIVQGIDREIYAFMRSGSRAKEERVLRLKSVDEGQSWSEFTVTELPNPNAAQVVAKVDKDLWIWIGNHNQDHRQDLTLAVSHDLEKPWQVVYKFENGGRDEAYAYPDLTQGLDGIWHLMYTANRKNIKHVQFNRVWLTQVMQQAGVL